MMYPKHVALIPDGNRTRAKENNKDLPESYMTAYEKGVELIEYTFTHTDIKVFTMRGLSTENTRNRPKEEFDFLMTMYKLIGDDLDNFLIANNVQFKTIGDLNGISEGFRNYLIEKENKTKCDSDRYLVFAINYGGRDEILRGIKTLKQNNYNFENITEEDLGKAMDLGAYPPIDLVIRTKGEDAQRTSGFMTRWIGYAELYFTKLKCPEFDVPSYQEALQRFDSIAQKRNFGK